MAGQASRWEWRTFGRHFGAAEVRLSKLPQSSLHESEETYLLATNGANVKIRDGLMDIKALQQVDSQGFEQWAPVMKAPFPLDKVAVAAVWQALSPAAAIPSGADLTLSALIAVLATDESGIRAVKVRKRRRRYTVEGCMAELSDLEADSKALRTIAIESDDDDAVLRGVDWLGLSGYANVSYPKALAALVDDKDEVYAVIDLGTNSVKFHIGARKSDGHWTVVQDRAEVTRLGEGLAQTGRIGEGPLDRTITALHGMADEARDREVRAIVAVGTAGLRIASNGPKVVGSIRKMTGIAVEILPGDEEARLAFQGATSGLSVAAGTTAVFDTGGGSSQFTFGHQATVDERFSVNVGAARYTEAFGLEGAVDQDRLKAAQKAISDDLFRLDGRPMPSVLIGMGGAITNITAVRHGLKEYDPQKVQGTVLDCDEIRRQIELYRTRTSDARRSIPGLQPKRAEVILAGACIVLTVMEKLHCLRLVVSDRGLRHGVLLERFG